MSHTMSSSNEQVEVFEFLTILKDIFSNFELSKVKEKRKEGDNRKILNRMCIT